MREDVKALPLMLGSQLKGELMLTISRDNQMQTCPVQPAAAAAPWSPLLSSLQHWSQPIVYVI